MCLENLFKLANVHKELGQCNNRLINVSWKFPRDLASTVFVISAYTALHHNIPCAIDQVGEGLYTRNISVIRQF